MNCIGNLSNKNSPLLWRRVVFLGLEHLALIDIQEIEIVVPVTGHSFLPPDRVFDLCEMKIRKLELIAKREEIYNLNAENVSLKIVGKDCAVADFREANKTFMKET